MSEEKKAEQDERGLAPTFGIPLYEDMRRALEHVECVYRLNFVADGESSSTLANLQRVIKRIHTESVEQDERGAFEAEWKRSGWGDADTKNQCFHFWQARAASTSANVAQGAEAMEYRDFGRLAQYFDDIGDPHGANVIRTYRDNLYAAQSASGDKS